MVSGIILIIHQENLNMSIKIWIDEPVFKRRKKFFGYTDIGWTVKHPEDLIKALVEEGVWSIET